MQTYDQFIRLAQDSSSSGDILNAMKYYAAAYESAPDYKEPLVKLALLYSEQGDVEGAIGFLEKAVEVDPDDAFVRLNLGIWYYSLERRQEAVQHLRSAVLLIENFLSSTRIDAMFFDGGEMDARIAQAAELQKTGEQALELLSAIAAELTSSKEGEASAA